MAFLPPALLALFAFYCGSFAGGATFAGAVGGQLLLLATAAMAAASWSDPLRLGRAGKFLPWALVAAVAASLFASPVARAGRVGLMLLPAFLLLPAFVARCWATERARAAGASALAAVVGGTSAWSLFELFRAADGWSFERAAMPLGHHNLLAALLVILLPLVAVGLRRAGPGRWLALAGIALAVAALLATRSFLHLGVLAVVGTLSVARIERARHLALGLALLGGAMLLPRAAAMVTGTDASAAARGVYAHAAWEGFRERPLLGWGPGSTPWTLAEFLRPLPGVNPPGEIVGEAHSLPLQLLYELGASGVLLIAATLALFAWRRWRGRGAAADSSWAEAGLLAILAALLSGLGGAWLPVTALPVALAIGAGAALAGEGEAEERRSALPVWTYVAVAMWVLAPLARAQFAYDAARRQPSRAAALPFVEKAMRLDPEFPLYRARWAWAATEPPAELRAANAIGAARAARGVSALWLRAGLIALEAERKDLATEAFGRALALDPLSAFAPFQLAPLVADPAACAARAFAAEPRLLAATIFRGGEEARQAAIRRLEAIGGIDDGWKQAAASAGRALRLDGEDNVDLVAGIDGSPALSLSLHAFRRPAWPADLARLSVDRSAVSGLRSLPAATALPDSRPAAFPLDRCVP